MSGDLGDELEVTRIPFGERWLNRRLRRKRHRLSREIDFAASRLAESERWVRFGATGCRHEIPGRTAKVYSAEKSLAEWQAHVTRMVAKQLQALYV